MSADSPIFVTGAPKTGKSVVLKLFFAMSECYVVDEPLATWSIGSSGREDDRRDAADATEAEISRVQKTIARQLQDAGKQRYVDLMSHHALQVPYLKAIYPRCRVIVLTRNPRDFIPQAVYFWTLKPSVSRALRNRWRSISLASAPRMAVRFVKNLFVSRQQGRLNTWGAVVPGQREFNRDRSPVEIAAYQWATLYAEVLVQKRAWPEGVFLLKFEDIKERPRETVRRLLSFCEIEATPALLDFAAGYFDPNHVTHQQCPVSEEQWRTAWPIMESVAAELGYQTPA